MLNKLQNLYYAARDWLFPRQRWLLKSIPNSWMDKDSVMQQAIFNCITEFIEAENPAEYTDWESDERHKRAWETINKVYHYIRKARPELVEEIARVSEEWYQSHCADMKNGHWNINTPQSPGSEALFAKMQVLEQQLEELDTKNLIDAVSVRGFLWV